MAKQSSPLIKLKGTIDGLSFYKTQDGHLAKEKTVISAERIRTDPKFRRTLLNGLEFGSGGRAGKTFRKAFRTEIEKAADNRVVGRVTRLMVSILQTDPVHGLGDRKVQHGDLSKLEKFEFNIGMPLGQVYKPELKATINRLTGQVSVPLPSITPQADIIVPDGDTHYNIFAAAAAIDFEGETYISERQSTGNLPWNSTATVAGALTIALPANSTLPLFVVMGIEFVKIVNGFKYPSSIGQSALNLVALDIPAPVPEL